MSAILTVSCGISLTIYALHFQAPYQPSYSHGTVYSTTGSGARSDGPRCTTVLLSGQAARRTVRRAKSDDQRLPVARPHQQGGGHPLHCQRRDAHAGTPLRSHAAANAGRGGRQRRVLHAARRRPLHGQGDDPQLGETVLDPACGTGGFLVEAFEHLQRPGQDRRGPQDATNAAALRVARRSRCRTCSRR